MVPEFRTTAQGLPPRIEEAVAHEARHECRARGEHATAGRAYRDSLLGQPFDDMERSLASGIQVVVSIADASPKIEICGGPRYDPYSGTGIRGPGAITRMPRERFETRLAKRAGLTTSTSQGRASSTRSAVLPMNTRFNPERETAIDLVPNKPRARQIDVALSNSFGFGGTNASLIFKEPG